MELAYRERYVGKPHPVYSVLEELIAEGIEYLRIMSGEEVWELVDNLPRALTHSISQRRKGPFADEVLDEIAEKYIVVLVRDRYAPLKDVFTTDLASSEVLKIYPELRERFDDDGLLTLDASFRLSDNGIEYRDHVLHYHQLLRRGYFSQPNFDFLRQFISYYSETNSINMFRIAIDHRRIMPREFFRELVEFDTWYGPRFDKGKLDDPYEVGFTLVKCRISGPMRRLFFPDLDRTEFYWSYRDGVKTFQVEEISGQERLQETYYLNRYIHSERDIEQKILRHFDGAVKVYLQADYPERLVSNMPREPRSHWKPKLFRIDARVNDKGELIGNIDIEKWIELTSLVSVSSFL
jgi:hypothetical protein